MDLSREKLIDQSINRWPCFLTSFTRTACRSCSRASGSQNATSQPPHTQSQALPLHNAGQSLQVNQRLISWHQLAANQSQHPLGLLGVVQFFP